jgi:hypothetical protein
MQILELAVYSHDGRVRRLRFRLGALNIITGGSKTGKSAIQQIVEYCLGNSTCDIPAGVIWDSVSWYALLLQFEGTSVFVARKHPETGKKSSETVHIEIGAMSEVAPFESLRGNSTPQQMVGQLSRLLGIIPNIHIPPAGQTRPEMEATLNHARLLLFQTQSEIANQKFLFHRQGEPFIPQAIRDTLPYFLGAVPEDLLAKQRDLKLAKDAHRAAVRARDEARSVAGEGLKRAYTLLSEAEDAGLLDLQTAPVGDAEIIGLLRSVATWRMSANQPVVTDARSAVLLEEITHLRSHADQLRVEITEAKKLSGEIGSFGNELHEQRARLAPLGLVSDDSNGPNSNRCPICLSTISLPVPAVSEMQRSLNRLTGQLEAVEVERPRLADVIGRMELEQSKIRADINEKRRAYEAVAAQRLDFVSAAELDNRRAHVVGRISLYLESLPSVASSDAAGWERRVAETQAAVQVVETWFDNLELDERVASAVNLIGREMSQYAEQLQMEWGRYPLRLDVKKLTVSADAPSGPVTMERMGSAENWLACHLVAHLSLHGFFVAADRPVPRFLILDQPTQVYYPPDRDASGSIDSLRDEDQQAVRRIFSAFLGFVAGLSHRFQLIVTDHADLTDERFQNAVVERWRGDLKLIPLDWPTNV